MDLDHIKDSKLLLGDDTEETVPPALLVSAPVLDIGFHPRLPIFAVGLVTGEIEVYQYQKDEIVKKPLVNDFSSWVFGRQKLYSEEEVVINHHRGNLRMHPTGSVSAMEFTDDGSYLVTTSSDRTISVLDCVSERLVIHIPADEVKQKTAKGKKLNDRNRKGKKSYTVTPNPHKYGLSALNVCDENMVATGDDDGLIAIWDMRERKPVHTYHEHGDYVSQLCYFTDTNEVVSSSGDTCLGCYDVRGGRVRDFSERRKDEINCFAFINSTGTNNQSFIPSILCGTPGGSLPLWKYGSWRRPYDVMEYHPRECESIVAFHGEHTAFNHNMVLTGACDGLVRVLQLYPVRRNICQISARDYTYSHQNASLNNGNASSSSSSGNIVVRKGRGHEGISRMRVSHDNNLLAVSGSDNIIDFVDIHFLNEEKLLDQLRGKAEQRHMSTLRRMEAEADEAEAAEERARAEEQALFSKGEPHKEAVKEESSASKAQDSDDDNASSSSSGSSSSGSEPTEDDKKKSVAMKDKLITLLRERAAAKKREREERERQEALQQDEEDSTSDDDSPRNQRSIPVDEEGDSEFDSSDDADMFSSDDEAVLARKKRQLRAKRSKQRQQQQQSPQQGPAASSEEQPSSRRIRKKTEETEETSVSADTPSHEAQAKTAMEAYMESRKEKRERVAAAKWLKEEKRKKVNFTYEKRRRRVGGFFGDMVKPE